MTDDSRSKPKQFFHHLLLSGTISAVSKALLIPREPYRMYSHSKEDGKSTLKEMLKEKGLSSLSIRKLTNITQYASDQALNFAFYDLFRTSFCSSFDPKTESWRFLFGHMAAGAAAGGVASLFLYPQDWSKLGFSKDGVLGLYKGFGLSAAGVMLFRSIYFGGYETAKKVIFPHWEQKGFIGKYFVALVVTNLAAMLSNPAFVVKKRMMTPVGFDGEIIQYKGALDCAKKLYNERGLTVFLRGNYASCNMGIFMAWNLVIYDQLKAVLFEKNKNGEGLSEEKKSKTFFNVEIKWN